MLGRAAPALRAAEAITKGPDLGVPGNAILANQVEGRDLDLAPAFATHVDHLAMPEVIEGRIGPTRVTRSATSTTHIRMITWA